MSEKLPPSLNEQKVARYREDLVLLLQQYAAVANARRVEVNPATQVVQDTQLHDIELRIAQLETLLAQYSTTPATNPVPASATPTEPESPGSTPADPPPSSIWAWVFQVLLGTTFLAICGIIASLLGAGCDDIFCNIAPLRPIFCGHCYPTNIPSPTVTDTATATSEASPSPTLTPVKLVISLDDLDRLLQQWSQAYQGRSLDQNEAFMRVAQTQAVYLSALSDTSIEEAKRAGQLDWINGQTPLEQHIDIRLYGGTTEMILITSLSSLDSAVILDQLITRQLSYTDYGAALVKSELSQRENLVLILGQK
jgi:hypothetical protein